MISYYITGQFQILQAPPAPVAPGEPPIKAMEKVIDIKSLANRKLK